VVYSPRQFRSGNTSGRVNRWAGAHLRVCYASANRKHHEKNSRLQSLDDTRQSLVPVYDSKMLPDKDLQDLVVFFATP
jgi:hypothetical protein